MSAEKVETSVEDDIAAAMQEIADKPEDPVEDAAPAEQAEPTENSERARDEGGKFTKAPKEKEAKKEHQETVAEVQKSQAPQSWGAAVKDKWAALDPAIQAEINKREKDFHQAMTRNDGELSLGRELKEVIAPYMPIIQAEGGTPAKAVQSLLNTAYVLRTGTPEQKANAVHQIAQNYGVDLTQTGQQTQLDPAMQQILQRIDGIEGKFTQHMTLQQQQENDRINAEVSAFAADPKNVYFEQLKPAMAPLLGSGQAKDLQEAYDMACWANPEIRSTLIQQQQTEEAEKRKQDLAKKKAASVSVTGSPGVKSSSSTPNSNSVEDDVRAAMNDLLN